MITIEKTLYKHYRVPEWDFEWGEQKGIPLEGSTYRYSSGLGFLFEETLVPDKTEKPSNRGGKTVCTLVLSNGTEVTGESICSLSDNFNRKRGREISFGRAYKLYLEYINQFVETE